MIKAGANVILCGRGIDDFALKYFVEAGAIAIRRVGKSDLRRIAKSSGAQILVSLADFDGDEVIDSSALGECAKVYEQKLGDWDFTMFEGFKTTRA